jgi:predicted SAM-dependent methyltransferase
MERKYGLKVETIMQLKSNAKTLNYKLYARWKTLIKVKLFLNKDRQIKLEIGSGPKKGINGWTTLDITNKCDLKWDLREGIPFPDNSVSIIYSSHLFEHIPYNGIVSLLKECHRVLKKDGVFSICVPNAKPYILGYANKDKSFWNSIPGFYVPALSHHSPIDMINYIAYMAGEHKYMFDEENLVSIIAANGFKNARTRSFDAEFDLKERDIESIYAIATVDK